MGTPIGPAGREPLSPAAREMDEEVREDELERAAEEGARDDELRHEYRQSHPGFFRRLFRKR
jgi:hypothetical protein